MSFGSAPFSRNDMQFIFRLRTRSNSLANRMRSPMLFREVQKNQIVEIVRHGREHYDMPCLSSFVSNYSDGIVRLGEWKVCLSACR